MKPRSCKPGRLPLVAAVIGTLLLAACADMMSGPAVDYEAIIAQPDRSDADRKNDIRRKAAQLLAFTGIRPGMKVLDLATGGGYSTELMARGAGPSGVVYGQEGPNGPPGGIKAYEARSKAPAMQKVIRLIRPYDDPVPAEVRDLDLITFFFEYHEMERAKADRVKMNRRFFEILKPGGILVITDHAARAGDGIAQGASLHRVEESLVRREVEAAGFRLIDEGHFLRNPADKRDITVFKNNVPNDEFVLKFQKPR
ncbi:MAG: methyltransferase [Betaproteobacteria bacterium]|nr:methyltransferase [Betaproteobacteria bacterium]